VLVHRELQLLSTTHHRKSQDAVQATQTSAGAAIGINPNSESMADKPAHAPDNQAGISQLDSFPTLAHTVHT
jgi:hypothetical protein